MKEQKRMDALVLREWNKPREDLELDDLKVRMVTFGKFSLI